MKREDEMEISVDQDYADGQSDGEIGGYKTVETVETKIGADGVEETHITHEVKRASRWTFGSLGKRYEDNYETIDWSDE